MTDGYHPDLHRLALAAAVDSPTSFSIRGRRIEPGADHLLPVLESELYRRLYCGTDDLRSLPTEDPAESLAFVAALSRANTGVGTFEPGWTISGEPDGSAVIAYREGVAFRVERTNVRTASGAVSPGQPCSVRISKEMRHLLTGFYMALGNSHPGFRIPLVRLYWHLTPDAAIRYLQEATGRLNGAKIPFQTKVVSNPRHYVRRDSGVLYLRRDDFPLAAPVLREIYQGVRTGLLPEVPLFTKPLAPGLALAEDPGNGMSFGQSRCRIAALGLWQCHVQGLADPNLQAGAIADVFRAEGLDPERPYLEPGSADRYEIDAGFGG